MTKIKNRIGRRVASLALAILTVISLMLSLSACGDTVEYGVRIADEEPDSYVARIISTNDSYRLYFLAASNGYDIIPESVKEEKNKNYNPMDDYYVNGVCAYHTNSDGDGKCDRCQTEVVANEKVGITAARLVMSFLLADGKFENANDKKLFEDKMNALSSETAEATAASIAWIRAVTAEKSFKTNFDLKADNGLFTYILLGIGKALGWVTSIVGNYYVLAIMVFALIIEVAMLPVAIKQQKNSIGMAKLRPAMARIEKKYAGRNDPVTLQKKREEIMALQQKEGFSPFAGCGPLLIQLLIVGFVLYPIIQNPLRYVLWQSDGFSSALVYYATAPVECGGLGIQLSSADNVIELLSYLNADNMAKITDFALIGNGSEVLARYNELSIPNFTALGINLGRIPSLLKNISILVLVPLLNVAAQWLTMFLTKKWNSNAAMGGGMDGQDMASQKIMLYLPLLMTLWILFKIPAMIGVYWLFRSLVSLLKQYFIQRALPVPKFTAEQLKEIEKADKEREKAQKMALKQQPKVRSLHYIDADDYDDLPEAPTAPQEKNRNISATRPEIKD